MACRRSSTASAENEGWACVRGEVSCAPSSMDLVMTTSLIHVRGSRDPAAQHRQRLVLVDELEVRGLHDDFAGVAHAANPGPRALFRVAAVMQRHHASWRDQR